MSHTVEILNATKAYGDFRAVNNVSVEIKSGEFFTLLGPSGCGKTTLLRMIAGFNSIDSGEIRFGDKVINDVPAHKRNVGMVFQNYAIFPHMTVEKNVAFGLKARNISKAESKERVLEAMNLMQIAEYKDRSPNQLSGGQQQRVALARAIVIHPDVLLMDEPLSNLDAKLRVQMRSSIKKLQRSLNITTIYVTHDQEEALAISDRIAVMNRGEIEQLDKPTAIYQKPINQFVANFIGTSSFIPAKATGDAIIFGGKKTIPVKLKNSYSGDILLALRPEQIQLDVANEKEPCGEIQLATFLGDYVNYEIKMSDGTNIEVNEYMINRPTLRNAGDKVSILPKVEDMSIFTPDGKEALL